MASQNMGPPMSAPTGFLSPYVARQQDGMRPGTQAYALPQQHQSGLAKISKFALGKLGGAFQTASTTAAFNAEEDQVLAAQNDQIAQQNAFLQQQQQDMFNQQLMMQQQQDMFNQQQQDQYALMQQQQQQQQAQMQMQMMQNQGYGYGYGGGYYTDPSGSMYTEC